MNHARCRERVEGGVYPQAQRAPVVVSTAAAGRNCAVFPLSRGFTCAPEQRPQRRCQRRDEDVLPCRSRRRRRRRRRHCAFADDDGRVRPDAGAGSPAAAASTPSARTSTPGSGRAARRGPGAPKLRPPSVDRATQMPCADVDPGDDTRRRSAATARLARCGRTSDRETIAARRPGARRRRGSRSRRWSARSIDRLRVQRDVDAGRCAGRPRAPGASSNPHFHAWARDRDPASTGPTCPAAWRPTRYGVICRCTSVPWRNARYSRPSARSRRAAHRVRSPCPEPPGRRSAASACRRPADGRREASPAGCRSTRASRSCGCRGSDRDRRLAPWMPGARETLTFDAADRPRVPDRPDDEVVDEEDRERDDGERSPPPPARAGRAASGRAAYAAACPLVRS